MKEKSKAENLIWSVLSEIHIWKTRILEKAGAGFQKMSNMSEIEAEIVIKELIKILEEELKKWKEKGRYGKGQ